ncbi:hypothetical protein Tco_1032479 [Tanacetum coccineum]|uniref:Uncharacterized protein n=1 Tax=Tanacetum coccineum TaxID=301880 RepID=A0ABQ5GDN5_9ASTR
MLEKHLYDSLKSIMELYMQNIEHGRMKLESVEHGLLIWPTITENSVTRTKKYEECVHEKKFKLIVKVLDKTKNDRILQISSSTQKKNRVEDHSRIVNSMFDARHELCFLEFVSDMNASSKSKSVKKAKKKEEWKPTRKVFTKIGYNWRPTERTFTLVRNACPLTRITATNKVPLREPIPLEIAKFVISDITNVDTSQGSNTLVTPSSSSVDLQVSNFFCGIGFRILKAHEWRSL